MKYLFFFLLLTVGCTSWKNVLVSEGNQNDAIKNAIYDFLNTSSLSKEDSVFNLTIYDDYIEKIIAINIYGTTNKLLISTEDSIEYDYNALAVDYKEINKKFFYWYDSTKEVTPELINTLVKYNMVDTTVLNAYIPSRHIDHNKKGVDYYFCKVNLLNYKKVKTNKAFGYYNIPKLNCD